MQIFPLDAGCSRTIGADRCSIGQCLYQPLGTARCKDGLPRASSSLIPGPKSWSSLLSRSWVIAGWIAINSGDEYLPRRLNLNTHIHRSCHVTPACLAVCCHYQGQNMKDISCLDNRFDSDDFARPTSACKEGGERWRRSFGLHLQPQSAVITPILQQASGVSRPHIYRIYPSHISFRCFGVGMSLLLVGFMLGLNWSIGSGGTWWEVCAARRYFVLFLLFSLLH